MICHLNVVNKSFESFGSCKNRLNLISHLGVVNLGWMFI